MFTRFFPEKGYQHGEIVTEQIKKNPDCPLKEGVKAALESGDDTQNIYGAIWAKSGLKFVAKMSKTGRFYLCGEYGETL